MNKLSRLLGSATLASCLALGGGAMAAAPAFAGGDYDDRKWSYEKDRKDKDKDRKDRERNWKCHHHDARHHHNHYSHNRDCRYDKDCSHRHQHVYYKDHHGNWKVVIIIVYAH